MAADVYKEKYRTLIDEFEEKERLWAGMDQQVRKILSHLLIIAQGPVNAKISHHLGQIRDSLKSGAPLADIEKEVARLRDDVMTEAKDSEAAPPLPVNEVIIRILQRIPLPKDMLPRVAETIKQLEGGLTSRMVPWAINSVGNFVLEVRSRMEEEKQQLEALLEEITGKIAAMGSKIGSTGDYALEGFVSNRSLNEKVTAQVAAIRHSADRATDLNSFRSAVNSALSVIQGHLDAKGEEDRKREQGLKEEVESLRSHVGNLEKALNDQQDQLKKAREESYRDPLTGCLNRLAYERRMGEEIARARRYKHPLSVILFDLDKFKSINDTFGHLAGDQVLKAISGIAASQLREIDSFCRYGGEEFIAILPETEISGALTAAEKVRKAVENFRFHSRGQRVPITISSGISEFRPGEALEALVGRADKALYKAKEEGRNRCVLGK